MCKDRPGPRLDEPGSVPIVWRRAPHPKPKSWRSAGYSRCSPTVQSRPVLRLRWHHGVARGEVEHVPGKLRRFVVAVAESSGEQGPSCGTGTWGLVGGRAGLTSSTTEHFPTFSFFLPSFCHLCQRTVTFCIGEHCSGVSLFFILRLHLTLIAFSAP